MSNPSLRDQLKAKFADHAVPSGKDFADLINAALIPADDGLALDVTAGQFKVDHPAIFKQPLQVTAATQLSSLSVEGSAQFDEGLNLRAGEVLQADKLQAATTGGELQFISPLQLSAAAKLGSTLDISGKATLHDDLHVSGKLLVSGPARFDGGLELQAGDVLKTNKLQAVAAGEHLQISSPLQLQGELLVDRLSALNRGAVIRDGLTVSGNAQLNDGLSVGEKLDVNGPLYAADTLRVKKDAHLAGNLYLAADQVLHTNRIAAPGEHDEIAFGSPSQFGKAVSMQDKLKVGRELAVGGDTTLAGALQVDKPGRFGETLNVSKATTLQGTLHVADAANLAASLDVAGLARFDSGLSLKPDTVLRSDRLQASTDDGLLRIDSATTISGAVNIDKRLQARGATALDDSLTVAKTATLSDTLSVAKATTLHDTLSVAGAANLATTLDVAGHGRFSGGLSLEPATCLMSDQLQASSHEGTLTVLSPTRIEAPLHVNRHLSVSADSTLDGALQVGKAAVLNDTLSVAKPATLQDSLAVTGSTTLQNTLKVAGDSRLDQHLNVGRNLDVTGDVRTGGQSTVEGGLTVRHHDKEKSPLEICNPHENFSPLLVSASGNVGINQSSPEAQLHLLARPQRDVLLLQHLDEAGQHQAALHIDAAGRLAIGRRDARVALDVNGAAEFAGAVHAAGDLDIDGRAVLHAVDVETTLSVQGKAHLKGTLEVDGGASFDQGQTTFGLATFHHDVEIKSGLNVAAAANVHGDADVRGGLRARGKLSADNDVAIAGKLEVARGTAIKGGLSVSEGSTFKGGSVLSEGADIKGGLALDSGVRVTALSDDPYLGEEAASNSVLATQKAVKAYVDTYASPFGRGGRTWSIRTQAEFDQVFGNGSGEKQIADNTTIILLAPREQGHSHPLTRLDGSRIAAGCDEWQTIPAYVLKNPVRLGSGVSITGFNDDAVRVVKQHAACRLLIEGRADRNVSQITLAGFTFDGRGLKFDGQGGAISLRDARDIRLDARLIGHAASGNGGALYGENARRIRASNIVACQASSASLQQRKSFGGAAYGLQDSEIVATLCYADAGGAVAQCPDSTVTALKCEALYGGGAVFSERLSLHAQDCRAHFHGGGAYGCSDLSARGYWRGNTSCNFGSRNIVAYTGNRQWHLWRGEFVERRIEPGWHCHDI